MTGRTPRKAPGAPDLTEALALASTRTNILIERPLKRQTGPALAMLLPHGARALLAWTGDAVLPPNESATLLVIDVDHLTQDQQGQLLLWLDANQHRVRVIAISASPLFQLVQRGAFSEALFYRLNMVRVDDTQEAGLANGT